VGLCDDVDGARRVRERGAPSDVTPLPGRGIVPGHLSGRVLVSTTLERATGDVSTLPVDLNGRVGPLHGTAVSGQRSSDRIADAQEYATMHDAHVTILTLTSYSLRRLTRSRREMVSHRLRKVDIVGEAGNKPRKFRRPMPKVPKGAEANDIHLAGLSNSGGGVHGNRLDHEAASGRSQDLGRFGRLFLKLLGRYSKESPSE
jgi:hypothetical protein